MIRSSLALACTLSLFVTAAHGQAMHGVGNGAAVSFGIGQGAAPTNAADFVGLIQSASNSSAIAQNSYFSGYGNNNGFGYYAPAYAVGATGLGLYGLNGLNGNYSYNAIAGGYGANAVSPLLLSRTIANSNFYGNPVLTNVPYGVSNLYQLMPNQNVGIGNANPNQRQISGPKTNPGQGVAGAARGDSEASAILNGAVPSRENPRAARKAKAGGRRNLANRVR